mgnify:CR=1 FL=1
MSTDFTGFSELEFKYKADNISLLEFQTVMNSLVVSNRKDVSSWDHYYTNAVEDEFIRYRESNEPELTIKRKVSKSNNWERIEVDLPIDGTKSEISIISKFVELLGYSNKKSIYKTCFIYWLEHINFVYYIVYDTNMVEKSRFIEVEFNKSQLPEHLDKVESQLKYGQEVLAKLGLSPQNRLKKSLFEIFVK